MKYNFNNRGYKLLMNIMAVYALIGCVMYIKYIT
jgi:hypothetical protein